MTAVSTPDLDAAAAVSTEAAATTLEPELDPEQEEEEDEEEPFSDEIKFISRPRGGSTKDAPYAFIVVGEVYIPGYMVRSYTLRVGDWVRGMCKVAPLQSRLPYRATLIEHVEASSASPSGNGNSAEVDTSEYDTVRVGDDDESDTSEGNGQAVAQSLHDYIQKHNGELRLAGPPQQPGCLAHFYHSDRAAAETIKNWQLADSKPGVQAFLRSFPTLFSIVGRHPNQKICVNASTARGGAASKPAASGAMRSSAGTAPPPKANGSASTSPNSKAGTAPLISKSAMAAAARANNGHPHPKLSTSTTIDAADLRDQLIELRADLHVAAAALTSAQQRMERLEAAIEEGGASTNGMAK